jgi:VanZ family protein
MVKAGAARKAGRWALVVVWMGVIFAFSSRPGYSLPDYGVWDIIAKKGAHVTEYAILGWLIQRALGTGRAGWQAWVVAVLYAATDELHQSLVPSRNARVTDVMIDAAGAVIGVVMRKRCTWRRSVRLDSAEQNT